MTIKRELTKFTHVKTYQSTIGRLCMHCGRQATTTAVRKDGKFVMDVRYCDEHAEVRLGRKP